MEIHCIIFYKTVTTVSLTYPLFAQLTAVTVAVSEAMK